MQILRSVDCTARLEKVNGAWRIVALSERRSETFVDDSVIPFNEPYPLNSGQVVRLGYLAQQPVVFTFASMGSSDEFVPPRTTLVGGNDDVRKTNVDDKTVPVNLVKISDEKKEAIKQSKDTPDDPFAEFRERD